MEGDQKPKIKRPRLRKPASQIQRALDDLDIVMKDKSMKPAKLADIAMARLSCLQSLLLMESEEKKAKIKFADVEQLQRDLEAAQAENERLRAELGKKPDVKPDREETLEEKLARRGIAL